MMIVIITVATIVGMMSIAVMRMTMEKDIYWDRNHRVLRLHLLNISVIGGWDGRKALNIEHFYWTLLNIFIFQWLGGGTVGRPWTASSSTTSRSGSGRSLGGRGWPRRGGGRPPPRSPTSSSRTASKRGADPFHTHIAPLNIPENFFQENKSTQNIRNCDSKETHWKLRLLYCETCTEVGDPW